MRIRANDGGPHKDKVAACQSQIRRFFGRQSRTRGSRRRRYKYRRVDSQPAHPHFGQEHARCVLFIHPAFPAQFGLDRPLPGHRRGWPTTFLTAVDTTQLSLSFNHLNYRLVDHAPQPKVFTNPESLQEMLDHLAAIYRGMRGVPQIQPDLVVGHMSYGTMLYLRNLYPCHFVGYFDYLPPPFWTDAVVLRKEFPPPEGVRLFNATYHAMTHLHLHACDAAYTSTEYQLSTCPPEWQHKLRVIRDGVDCQLFQPRPRPTRFRGRTIDPDTRVVSFTSRGLEAARGFDVFMRVAKRIAAQHKNVLFVVAGGERTLHGHEGLHLGAQSFKQWVLQQDEYDLSRFLFVDFPPVNELAELFNLTDLHLSLSVPHLAPSTLLPAMASGCPLVASRTAAIAEHVDDGTHAVLHAFADEDALTETAVALLADRERARALGEAARQRVLERHELTACLEAHAKFFDSFPRPVSRRCGVHRTRRVSGEERGHDGHGFAAITGGRLCHSMRYRLPRML
ncbi:MAG: glycosyltransferase [Gemmataceae bacterium]